MFAGNGRKYGQPLILRTYRKGKSVGYYVITGSGDKGPFEPEQIETLVNRGKLQASHRLRVGTGDQMITVGELMETWQLDDFEEDDFDEVDEFGTESPAATQPEPRRAVRSAPNRAPRREAPQRSTLRDRAAFRPRRKGPRPLMIGIFVVLAVGLAIGGWFAWNFLGLTSIKAAQYDFDWPGDWERAEVQFGPFEWKIQAAVDSRTRSQSITILALDGLRKSWLDKFGESLLKGLVDEARNNAILANQTRTPCERLGMKGERVEVAIDDSGVYGQMIVYSLKDTNRGRVVMILGRGPLDAEVGFREDFEKRVDSFRFR